MRGSRHGQDSQQLSLEASMQQSPMSSLVGDSRAHSMPNPLPSPVSLRSPSAYSPAHSHHARVGHNSPVRGLSPHTCCNSSTHQSPVSAFTSHLLCCVVTLQHLSLLKVLHGRAGTQV